MVVVVGGYLRLLGGFTEVVQKLTITQGGVSVVGGEVGGATGGSGVGRGRRLLLRAAVVIGQGGCYLSSHFWLGYAPWGVRWAG